MQSRGSSLVWRWQWYVHGRPAPACCQPIWVTVQYAGNVVVVLSAVFDALGWVEQNVDVLWFARWPHQSGQHRLASPWVKAASRHDERQAVAVVRQLCVLHRKIVIFVFVNEFVFVLQTAP